jgi:OFA family oxalate/formate antiporter-like MFS transporter
MDLDRRRWLYLIVSIIVLVCMGSIYAFSVLAGPLALERHWTPPQVALAFTLNTALAPIPMILGGKMVDRGWARAGVTGGAVLFGLAFVLTSLTSSIFVFYLAYGVMGGIGVGLAYSGALGNITRLFPDRRGLATGMLMAGNGAGAVVIAPLANWTIATGGVLDAWLYLGCAFICVGCAAGVVIRSAPNDYRPGHWRPSAAPLGHRSLAEYHWQQMIREPVFYLLLFILATGALSGLMVAANGAQIAQQMYGLSATQAAVYVGLYAVGSACGRLLWGALSDRIGRPSALQGIFLMVAIMLLLLFAGNSPLTFTVGFIGIGLSFGGLMGVFPPLVAERFGQKGFGVNYGVLFCGYSVAAFIGPRLGASIGAAHQGDYKQAFLIALLVCAVGAVAAVIFRKSISSIKAG